MMIMHLVNQESIIFESVLIARYGLAKELGIGPNDVKVKIDLVDNKVKPEFLVDRAILDRLSDGDVRKSMARVWQAVRDQMALRLTGLTVRRYD